MSNQYNPSAGVSAGGSNDTHTVGQEELNELLRQADAQARQIRQLKAEEPFNNMRLALLRAAIRTMLQSSLDAQTKTTLEGK